MEKYFPSFTIIDGLQFLVKMTKKTGMACIKINIKTYNSGKERKGKFERRWDFLNGKYIIIIHSGDLKQKSLRLGL